MIDLSGRRAIVTGGTGHIGRGLVAALAELGASVGVLDKNAAQCRTVVKDLAQSDKSRLIALPCDIADERRLRQSLRRGISALGGLDILIHCAAFLGASRMPGWAVPFDQQTVKAWDAATRVNLTSAFIMAQETRQALSKSNYGSVIFLSSIYGVVGPDFSLYKNTTMANPAAYNATKGGLVQLTRYLATLLAPGVRVNAISPGGLRRGQPAAFQTRYRKRTPLGRMATVDDIVGAGIFLASDMSAYVTGQNLLVDGGWTAW
jgi:NAD(P)-dependent dehydrogenase (short-subunit alcohol dehydrogenase family)